MKSVGLTTIFDDGDDREELKTNGSIRKDDGFPIVLFTCGFTFNLFPTSSSALLGAALRVKPEGCEYSYEIPY